MQDNTNKFFEMIDLNLSTKNQYQTLKTLVYVTALSSISYTKKIVIYSELTIENLIKIKIYY